ncbi:MAG: glycosyltransferase [Syntrophobacteraceae bacterium]
MGKNGSYLGMILKGYPRISESFISSEILLLESLGIPVEIYSLRQPRESQVHEHVRNIKAGVTYIPEYVLPNLGSILKSNSALLRSMGSHYLRCFAGAIARGISRRKPATIRHFLQAGHLVHTKLSSNPLIRHLHAHFCHTPASVAYFASELTGLPFSFTAHAKDIYTSEPDQLSRKIEKASFVVTCTRYNAEYLSRIAADAHLSQPRTASRPVAECKSRTATPIHTIYHGIDPGYFAFVPPAAPVPTCQILSVGRLVPKKGYDDLIKALRLLDRMGLDFHFTHIGDGENANEIKSQVYESGLESKVSFLGTLSHEEVITHYRRAHCFVLACKVAKNGDRDGIPNVIAEAMACGLPVVATNVSAIPELVVDGETGILVPPEDPRAMAAALHKTLLDPKGNTLRAKCARRKVEQAFDSRKCVLQLHSLFSRALNGGADV